MKVTYYVVRKEIHGRGLGTLVPEAMDWPFVQSYVNDARLAPVLVCTLPEYLQDALSEWETARETDPSTPWVHPDDVAVDIAIIKEEAEKAPQRRQNRRVDSKIAKEEVAAV